MSITDIKQMIVALRSMGLNEQFIGFFVSEAHASNQLLLD